jgi:hypothetical protein
MTVEDPALTCQDTDVGANPPRLLVAAHMTAQALRDPVVQGTVRRGV